MMGRMIRRVVALALACAACFAALVVPASAATGETWLNWVWENAGAGIHAKWYYHFEQAAADVNKVGNSSCANGWLGSKGSWVFGHDSCSFYTSQAATARLNDPGTGAYPWAQSAVYSDYLWGWAGYCGSC
jgi:hypothetical protein